MRIAVSSGTTTASSWPVASAVALVGPMGVEVLDELGQDRSRVPLVVDQHPVGALSPNGAHEPLGVPVRRGKPRRAASDLDVLGGEHGVEALGELPAAVSDQMGEGVGALAHVGQQIAGGLRRPGTVRIRSNPEDVHVPGAHLHDEQNVDPSKIDRVDVEEVCGQQALALAAQERLPGRVGAHPRWGPTPGGREDPADRADPDPVAQAE